MSILNFNGAANKLSIACSKRYKSFWRFRADIKPWLQRNQHTHRKRDSNMHCFHYFMRCLQILRLFNSLNLLRLVHIVCWGVRFELHFVVLAFGVSASLSLSVCVFSHLLFHCLHLSYRSVQTIVINNCERKKERSQPQHHSPTNRINIIFIFVDSILL